MPASDTRLGPRGLMAGPWLLCVGLCCAAGIVAGWSSEPVGVGCSTGLSQVALEPGRAQVLDCRLGHADQTGNVTWREEGEPLQERAHLQVLPNGSLSITHVPEDPDQENVTSEWGEGNYSCVHQNAFGTVVSRDISLRLSDLQHFHQQPESQTVWEHSMAHLECRVEGLPVPVITWEKNEEILPPDTRFIVFPSGILQIVDVQLWDAGTYRCLASNVVQQRYSAGATLEVLEASSRPYDDEVTITAAPKNTTVNAGQSAVMECQAAAQPPPMVSWIRQDGKPIATDVIVLGEANLLIAHAQPHHSGVYVCRANRPRTRHFVTASAELRVLAPPVIAHFLESVSRPPASTARLVCSTEGDPAPSVSWLKNGVPVLPSGRVKTTGVGSLIITQIGLEDAGYYQCIAENSQGTACATTQLSVVVREGLPSAPKSVTAVPMSSTAIAVTWERPEYNSEQLIGYSLHYQKFTGTDNIENQFALHNDTLEFQVKDLQPDTNYVFYVVAYSQLGASRSSAPVTVQTWEDVPSAAPQLSLSSTTPNDIQAAWLPLEPELSNGRVTKYKVDYCSVKEVEQVTSVEVPGNETQVTLTSLHANRAYNVRISAATEVGYGAPSDWMQHRTPEKVNKTHVPLAPTELKVRARTDSLVLSWQPPSNHAQISGYKLFYREVSSEDSSSEDMSKGAEESWDVGPIKLKKKLRQYDILQLAPGRLYKVKLVAYNKYEDGFAAVWRGKTEAASVPGLVLRGLLQPPSNVEAEPRSPTSVWVKWKKPDFNSVKIVNYTVRCSRWGQQNASLVTYHSSSAEEVLISGLKPYTRYEFAVKSNGLGIDGPFSGAVERATPPDRPSTPPVDVQLNPLSAYAVRVTWRPPLEPNGAIVEYFILYSANSTLHDHLWTPLTKEGNVLSAEIQGLESSKRYFFKMAAKTSVGTGPFSPVKEVLTFPPKTAEVLDIHSVTGIIVGVCLGLLCILFCMCASFRNSKHRDSTVGLDPQASGTPSYCNRGRQSTGTQGPTSDSHELESLMPPRPEEVSLPLTEVTDTTEGPTLVGSGLPDESTMVKLKPMWNGSINPNWVNNITIYGDAKTPASTANGLLMPLADAGQKVAVPAMTVEAAQNEAKKAGPHPPATRNRVEAEVIVHSDYSASERSCEHDPGQSESEDLLTEAPDDLESSASEQALPQTLASCPPGCESAESHHDGQEATQQTQEELFKAAETMESTVAQKLTNGFHQEEEIHGALETGEAEFLSEGPAISTADTNFLTRGQGLSWTDTDFSMEDRGSSRTDKQPLLSSGLQDTSLCINAASNNSIAPSEAMCP